MRQKGTTLVTTLIIVVLITAVVLFTIPHLRSFNDQMRIKRALRETEDWIRITRELSDTQIQKTFFSELNAKEKVSVEVLPEDFTIERFKNNRFNLRCRYVNEEMIMPIVKIRLKDVDKYLETKEF
jgi:rRNA maturation endonuclease Nob1